MNIIALLPEIIVLIMVGVTLLADLFTDKKHAAAYYCVQATMLACLVVSLCHLGLPTQYAFGKSFVVDEFALMAKTFVYVMAFFVFLYSRRYLQERNVNLGEYYVLSLLAILGVMLTISGNSLLLLYLGIELMSLPIYVLVASDKQNLRGTEAAMKYFVLGAVASGLLLFGMSYIFGLTGTLNISQIVLRLAFIFSHHPIMLTVALVFVLLGMMFKFGAAPMHMWVPDVYQGAPSSVTLFIGTVPKIAAFGLLVRLLIEGLAAVRAEWHTLLVIVAVLSIGFGNIAAISQTNIRRLFAYSSVAHMGYMLLGIIAAGVAGFSSAFFYLIAYVFMSLAAFGFITCMASKDQELQHIEDLAGLNAKRPWLAFCLLLTLFSMAGIPPLLGFMAKVGVLEALIRVHMSWLAVYAIVLAVIASYYYLKVIKVMYFEQQASSFKAGITRFETFILSINSFAVLLIGIFPNWLFHLARLCF